MRSMIQFYPSSESIYYDQDISLIRKWTDEVYIETFHWRVCRGCKSMCIDWNFQYVHLLITRTTINVISDMLSLIFPSPSQYTKIGMLHNSIVGHFGLERTLKRFKDLNDTWEYQRQHIRYYIDHCPCILQILETFMCTFKSKVANY